MEIEEVREKLIGPRETANNFKNPVFEKYAHLYYKGDNIKRFMDAQLVEWLARDKNTRKPLHSTRAAASGLVGGQVGQGGSQSTDSPPLWAKKTRKMEEIPVFDVVVPSLLL